MHPFLLAAALLAQAPVAPSKPPPPSDETAAYHFLLGRHYESSGQIDRAIAAHRRAIELEPGSAELRAALAALYARQDRAVEALEHADAALQRNPANRDANRIAGSVYAAYADGKQPIKPGDDPSQYAAKAIAAFEKARGDVPDVSIEFMLGRLYLQTKAFDKAIPALRRVVDEQPGYGQAATLLASALHSAGRVDEAIAALETVVAENPRFYQGFVRLGELYDERRRPKEAAEAYAAAQALNPRADFTVRRAASLLDAGDAAQALPLLEATAKKSAKPDAAVLYLLAHAQRRLKNLDAASAAAETLRKTFPDDVRGLYVMAAVLESKRDYPAAAGVLRDLLKRAPDDASLVYQYAHVLEKSGKAPEAERALRELLAKDPKDANALNSLGYMFAERGEKLDEAVDLLQRALKIEPGNPSFLDSLGWAYFRQGKIELAEAPLSEAASKLPDNSEVQDHLGDLRFRQKRYDDAVRAWERALAGDGDEVDRAEIEKKLKDARSRLRRE